MVTTLGTPDILKMLNISPMFMKRPQPPTPPTPPPLPPVELNNDIHPRAQSIAKYDSSISLTPEESASAKTAFALFEKKGRISFNDIPEALRFLGFKHCKITEQPEHQPIPQTSRTADVTQFLRIVNSLQIQSRSSQEDREYQAVFEVMDKDGDGLISKEDLQHIITNLGEAMKQGEAEKIIKEATREGNSTIDYDTFVSLMQQFETKALSAPKENHTKLVSALRRSCEQIATLAQTNDALQGRNLEQLCSLISKVKRKIETNTNCKTIIPIHSDYWLECDGLTVFRSFSPLVDPKEAPNPNGETDDQDLVDEYSDEDRLEEAEIERQLNLISPSSSPESDNSRRKRSMSAETEYLGRVYSVCLKPYVNEWRNERDPNDNTVWQEKLAFRTYFQRYVWPKLTREQKNDVKEKWSVEYLRRKDLEAKHRVKETDSNGFIIDPSTGKIMEPGFWMFVVSANPSRGLYIARKIPGKIHHTSLSQGRPVACAGMLAIADGTELIKKSDTGQEEYAQPGRLLAILARSGHYKPSEESMLIAVEAFAKLGVKLEGCLLVYHEDESSRSCRIGGLKGAALMAKIGTNPNDRKVRLSSAFLQHLARQELGQRLKRSLSGSASTNCLNALEDMYLTNALTMSTSKSTPALNELCYSPPDSPRMTSDEQLQTIEPQPSPPTQIQTSSSPIQPRVTTPRSSLRSASASVSIGSLGCPVISPAPSPV
eukprot:TRINITY_DN5438_c0_g1_i3.p1 TRINITY_DN5438_c0_g1~~TRINITY_DN5438_c0_g1_i3.p1  ORF type:complete len:715 (-),score=134.92 TRINITY_DN5438_c0_g1_i3:118-2262(-)